MRMHRIAAQAFLSFAALLALHAPAPAFGERIAVIGTGNVGGGLGPEFAALGHTIVYGSREPTRDDVVELVGRTPGDASAATPQEAVADADIVLLAVPGRDAEQIVRGLGNLRGKIIIDPTNRTRRGEGAPSYDVEGGGSNAELIQAAAPNARVVKAFNTLNWRQMVDPETAGGPITIPIAGDDAEAKAVVAEIVEGMGLEAVDVGPLRYARVLEEMLVMWANSLGAAPFNYYLRPMPVFRAGGPLGAINEAGVATPLSSNVKVYGSLRFAESCTFDPERNLILAMNAGVPNNLQENDGYVSLVNPDGSVHTAKWIGATREGLTLNHPLGSAIRNGMLYTVDGAVLRTFDLATGNPLRAVEVTGATFLNGIGVTEDGTAYISNTRPPEAILKVSPDGDTSVFVEGPPLAIPNGVAIDNDGNIVVVNIGTSDVLTFDPAGELILTENAAESGNDGLVITEDGTKYVSSVRFGSVSRIRPGEDAEIIASGVPSAASMCYDSVQKQLVIPMNPNDALAFISLE